MRWHRSLYWRIAIGSVAFLAAMLVVQAVLFVWVVSQSGRTLPGQSPGRLGMNVALDLANLLEREPSADLDKYIREQYAQYEHPFFVMMADGRVMTSGSTSFPEPLLRMARARLERGAFASRGEPPDGRPGPRPFRPDGPPPFDRSGPELRGPGGPRSESGDPRFERFERFGDRFERDASGYRFVRPSPIIVAGHLAGVVVVPPQAPFGFLLGRYAPMLGAVAVGVLVLGAVLTSLTIFGPARRRLRELETAARRLGGGDLSARAPNRGGDEIAAVASAFNAMADDLAASDRARRQLLADVSHELNTPVTAIRGYLETLMMPTLTLEETTRARYMTIIADETARLERLVGDLLDLARLEGGGGELRIETVALEQLFARVAARHERVLADAGVTLRTTIEPGAETVAGDRDRLEQALQNLVANAIRYAPRGTEVRLSTWPANPGDPSDERRTDVCVAVEDAGAGIPAEHVPHIFDRFYKADSSRAGLSGSGLGLSIVRAIVERHGGRVSVQSRPGRTVFEIAGLRKDP